ncbi:hypothetical protein AAIR98_000868 [Elusimicrobium simillimum]
MERNNIRTQVEGVFHSSHYNGVKYIVKVRLKDFSEKLSLESLNFAICHPSFFRRFTLAHLEKNPVELRSSLSVTVDGGYGRSEESISAYCKTPEEGDKVLIFNNHDFNDEAINKEVQQIIDFDQEKAK